MSNRAEPGAPLGGTPPAGWYADPEHPRTQQRYWDGNQWTEQRAPFNQPPANPWLVGAGYVLSPIVIPSLIIGVILLAKRDRNWPWVIGLALLFAAGIAAINIWAE